MPLTRTTTGTNYIRGNMNSRGDPHQPDKAFQAVIAAHSRHPNLHHNGQRNQVCTSPIVRALLAPQPASSPRPPRASGSGHSGRANAAASPFPKNSRVSKDTRNMASNDFVVKIEGQTAVSLPPVARQSIGSPAHQAQSNNIQPQNRKGPKFKAKAKLNPDRTEKPQQREQKRWSEIDPNFSPIILQSQASPAQPVIEAARSPDHQSQTKKRKGSTSKAKAKPALVENQPTPVKNKPIPVKTRKPHSQKKPKRSRLCENPNFSPVINPRPQPSPAPQADAALPNAHIRWTHNGEIAVPR